MLDRVLNVDFREADREEIARQVSAALSQSMQEFDGKLFINNLTINVYNNTAVHDGASAHMTHAA